MVLLRRGRIICHLQKIMVSAKKKAAGGLRKKNWRSFVRLEPFKFIAALLFFQKMKALQCDILSEKKGLRRDDLLKTAIIGKIKTVEKVQHCFDVNFIQHRDEEFPL